MTILQEVLLEEYYRILRTEYLIQEELQKYPKGYISKKKIKGREYFYLQHREGNRIVSKYIPEAQLQDYQTKIQNRKRREEDFSELQKSKETIIRALGKEFINEYTTD